MTDEHYMSQLDGLRFFAVLGVLVAHNWNPGPAPWIFGRVNWGDLGVRLFFVLSGFLITGILVRGRKLGAHNPERRLFFIRQFYIRRFLRIFPIYYLYLVVIVLIGIWPARQIWPWLFTYTTNIYIWSHLHWIGNIGHLWTLAIEEQFYLVWPWMMLFLPGRCQLRLLLGLMCVSPIYRLYASFHYGADFASESCTLTIAVVDSLAICALLALASARDPKGERLRRVLGGMVLPAGIVIYAVVLAVSHYSLDRHALVALGPTGEALIFCWLVGSAAEGFRGRFGRVLEWRPIVCLGKISYGIYIFHTLVQATLTAVARRVGIGYEHNRFTTFLASSLVTFAIASLSWHLFEGPINDCKRHFRYDSPGGARTLFRERSPAGEASPVGRNSGDLAATEP
jgi:peptidoglycan/LPS O-acetylase OafA/YrhL